jgi:hypothetical protein
LPGDSDQSLLAVYTFRDAEDVHAGYASRMARVTRFSNKGILK